MLNINEIIKTQQRLDIFLKKDLDLEGFKGLYNPDKQKITIFYSNIQDKKDMDLTLLHEFIHARDDICYSKIYYIKDIIDYETSTENEAIETYQEKPHILKLIKDLYNIKKDS